MNKKAKMRIGKAGFGTQLGEREGGKREVANLNRCRIMGK